MLNGMTTRSPVRRLVIAGPTSSTMPIGSWPRMSPSVMKGPSTSYRCRSDPQMPLDVTRMTMSSGSWMAGSGTCSPRTSRRPCQVTAFIVAPSYRRRDGPGGSAPVTGLPAGSVAKRVARPAIRLSRAVDGEPTAMDLDRWFLSGAERGNPHTGLDERRSDGTAWTTGNEVRPLVHGRAYFAELLAAVRATRAGDLVLFTDWRGDPDERLGTDPDTEVSRVLCSAAERGVLVKGLIWRSHLDRFTFSAAENRHLGEEIEAAGGECVRDMRVRAGGSHHQKIVVVRYAGRPERDVAFVGGIDLCHSRNDGPEHRGDPQAVTMSPRYGPRPPWHDIQLAIRGAAVGDVEYLFREPWDDPAPVTRNPFYRLADLLRRDDDKPDPLPPHAADPAPCGTQAVHVLRTYACR